MFFHVPFTPSCNTDLIWIGGVKPSCICHIFEIQWCGMRHLINKYDYVWFKSVFIILFGSLSVVHDFLRLGHWMEKNDLTIHIINTDVERNHLIFHKFNIVKWYSYDVFWGCCKTSCIIDLDSLQVLGTGAWNVLLNKNFLTNRWYICNALQ